MNWRIYILLFFLGLAVVGGTALLQNSPGYLDSDYYFVGGLQLAEGKGFAEPFLWNYLDDPTGLPHPSHTYWLPLSSILAAASIFITGQHTFEGARLIFIILSACIPPLTAHLALDITENRVLALTSGLLAVFPVYYLPFLPVTDNYAPFILLGGLIFLLMKKEGWWVFFAMGILAGLMNLARSDGLLWLALVGLLSLWRVFETERPFKSKIQTFIFSGTLVVAGYLLIMGPWYARNVTVFDSPMAPGGSRILWLTNYNDIFAFPADKVNMDAWLEAGWGTALKVRLWALRMNILNAFAAQGSLLLFPFILIGFWQMRKDIRAKFAATGWLILFVAMTLVFPLAGARGGFFHAGAAFQTYWWSLAPLGLTHFVRVLKERKIFTARHAGTVFQGMLVFICAMLSGIIIQLRILQPGWQPELQMYEKVEQVLVMHGATLDEIAVVRNPALYYIVSGRSTIVMPPGGPDTILAVADKYGASFFVLEPEGVLEEYKQLYEHPDIRSELNYIGEVDGARIYAIHAAD